MTDLILDRFGRFRDRPALLAAVGDRERRAPRLVGFLVAAVGAALGLAVVAVLAITAAAALQLSHAQGIGFWDAFTLATGGGSKARGLLSYWYEFSVAGIASYLAALAVLALAARIYGRPMRTFLTAAGRFRWRTVAAGFAVGAAVIGLSLLVEQLWAREAAAAPLLAPGESLLARLGYLSLAASCLYLAALAEEIIFRGVLLQLTGAFTRSLPLILALNGLIFSLAHFDPDPTGFVIRALMGAGWAWIALRTAGIEFTTGVHLANNLIISLFIAPVSFKPPAAHAFDLRGILLQLATVVATALVVEVVVRRNAPDRAKLAAGAP